MEAYTEPDREFKTCELDYGRGKVKLGLNHYMYQEK